MGFVFLTAFYAFLTIFFFVTILYTFDFDDKWSLLDTALYIVSTAFFAYMTVYNWKLFLE